MKTTLRDRTKAQRAQLARRAEKYARRVNTDAAWLVAADAWLEAGNVERAEHMNTMRPSEMRRREREHDERERKGLLRDLREIESTPPHEARESIATLLYFLQGHPISVIEQLRWLMDGTYGHGAKQEAARIVLLSGRTNRAAILMRFLGAIAYSVPTRFMTRIWHQLTPPQQQRITDLVNEEIREALAAREP